MTDLLKQIEIKREAILLGEIGALLHMFGKASSEFLRANSKDKDSGAKDSHQSKEHFPKLWERINRPELKDAFSFTLHGQEEKLKEDGSFTDFITKYKGRDKDNAPDCMLLQLFNTCHRMTSADEKGVVRRKQSISEMHIATPFGYREQQIDPASVDSKRIKTDTELARDFDRYFNGSCDIKALREKAVQLLKPGLSQALGETRLPANDVTLWAQSHGVASLYKPVLATIAMGMDPCLKTGGQYNYDTVKWRLLGLGWNGPGFIQRGRKPADILGRQKILNIVAGKIQQMIEVEFPLGNLVYQDLKGLFFTFPGVADDAEAASLARELAAKIVPIVREQSKDELWPFFTLSGPRRTITMIAREIQVRDGLAALPRVATILSMEKPASNREESLLLEGPLLKAPAAGQDVCPVCGFRSKPAADESCSVCRERRQSRQSKWQTQREDQTIWVDEVADARNRVALLTLRFDLSRWLSGEWLTTVFSQTYEDWHKSDKLKKKVLDNKNYLEKLYKSVLEREQKCPVAPTIEDIMAILKFILANPKQDPGFRVTLLNTFFEDIKATQEENDPGGVYYLLFLENLKAKINEDPSYSLTAEDLAGLVFTQNPSPGRLTRIREETKRFIQAWLSSVDGNVFPVKPQRIRFKTCSPVNGAKAGRTYQLIVPNLAPDGLVVCCLDDNRQDFLTVDSLEKFRIERGGARFQGLSAVQQALSESGIVSWLDEETGERLSQAASPTSLTKIDRNQLAAEPYLPYIVLASSPVFCQALFPADRIPDILRQLLELHDERFAKVQGKLPLHVGLLIAKRKYPLYALLDAGQQILDHPSLKEGVSLSPWWNINGLADDMTSLYSGYPTNKPVNGKHSISGLTTNRSQTFWTTPGYFDFDLLGSTSDHHRLNYEDEGRDGLWPVRRSVGYGLICPRPFPLHHLQKMFDIRGVLSKLSRTQRHQLEEVLRTKLDEWMLAGEGWMPVFVQFGKAVLRDAYGGRWQELPIETKQLLEKALEDGMLLEALEFFQHVIKEREDSING